MKIPHGLAIVSPNLIPKGAECSLVDLPELYKLGLLMQAVCEKEKGIGLSAVQVGVPLNFFIVNFKGAYRYFVNCNYTPILEDKEKYIEGCLSIRSTDDKLRYFEVDRFKDVLIKGKELISEPILEIIDFEYKPTDYYKIVFQHEIQHQEGILISDHGKEVFLWRG